MYGSPAVADQEYEAGDIERKVHDLAQSIERVRSRQANQDDVIIDMKHARLSRLELLAENLAPVFDAVPDDNEQFEFALTKSEAPRLWIDMTSYVRMGRDGREYEFVKATRLGRTILARESNLQKIGERVSDYVAERLLERERMIEGDWISMQAALVMADEKAEARIEDFKTGKKEKYSWFRLLLWFAFGLVIGAALVASLVWFNQFESIIGWTSSIDV